MAEFLRKDLRGSRFERVDLSGSEFRASDLAGTRFRGVDLSRVVMRGVELVDADIHGEIVNLTINGVDIAPLVSAELDRRYPDRVKMRPTDPAGFREGWHIVEQCWDETVARARRLNPELLHESVDGEWSFIETLRHLVFATDSWSRRVILGDPSPWDALDLPWDKMPDMPGVPRDRDARPAVHRARGPGRAERRGTGRPHRTGRGPGWPKPRSYPVRECLLCILNEEWQHRLYAERDLDALQTRTAW